MGAILGHWGPGLGFTGFASSKDLGEYFAMGPPFIGIPTSAFVLLQTLKFRV